MNRRQLKKKIKKRNIALCKQYPFLIPRNVWTDKIPDGYNYSYTRYDEIPDGWRKAFGQFLLEELRDALVKDDYLDKFRFTQIKEKYGRLCLYNFGAPVDALNVIHKYEFLSEYVCYYCGSPEACIVNDHGWYLPVCRECWDKNNNYRARGGYKPIPYEVVMDEDYTGMPEVCNVMIHYDGELKSVECDISDTVKKIKMKWQQRNRGEKNEGREG